MTSSNLAFLVAESALKESDLLQLFNVNKRETECPLIIYKRDSLMVISVS